MNRYLYIICILAVSHFFFSCHSSIYDPESIRRHYFIQDIPENFDWSTTSEVSIEVIPNDRYAGQYHYTIEVFAQNPLLDSAALLCSGGWCNSLQPLKKTLVLPDALKTVYIRQTTPGGRQSVIPVEVINNQISCNFSPVAFTETTQSLSNKRIAVANKDAEAIPETYPSDSKEITPSTGALTTGNYVIQTYTGKLKFTDASHNINIYVAGTWINTAEETTLPQNTKLYILKEGEVYSQKEWKLKVKNNSGLYIAQGGVFKEENDTGISLEFENAVFINEGFLSVDDIDIENKNTKFRNNGEMHIDELDAEQPINITNAGSFYAHDVDLENNATFDNQCYAEIDELELADNARLNIAQGCAVKCHKLECDNSFITMEKLSLLEVTGEAEFEGKNKITGGQHEPALFKMEKLIGDKDKEKQLKFHRNIYIECHKYEAAKELCDFSAGGQMIDPVTGPQLEIPASQCSQGNDYIPEQPEEPEFPIIKTYTQSYTYASEDNYPAPGDYDMNDLVCRIDSVTYVFIDKENVNQLIWHLNILAAGATQALGAAIQLDQLETGMVKNVVYSKNPSLGIFELNSNRTEAGQTYAVIPLFDNVHKLLGYSYPTIVNTISSNASLAKEAQPVNLDITVEFTSPVKESQVDIDDFNYFNFIVSNSDKRVEIHMPKYVRTQKSNTPDDLHEVAQEYMWCIRVPGHFKYPHEWTNITKAYSQFEEWVHSEGTKHTDWYMYPETDMLYQNK